MKKVTQLFIVGILLLQYLYIPNVQGKTLGDLRKELNQKQADYNKNKTEKEATEKEIQDTKVFIANTQKSIDGIFKDINNLDLEIKKLDEDIVKKDKEMKDIMNFVQVSSGESAYMEYIFGAKDFTDFIYRMAISEQLTNYNDKLIKEYDEMIKSNKKKQEELANKRAELSKQQTELTKKVSELGVRRQGFVDIALSIDDEIKYQKELIDLYTSKGCKDNENIATCGRAVLPPGTAFYRPIIRGYATSEFGYRDYINGIPNSELHTGIDLSIRPNNNIPVYAAGTGMVAGTFERLSCGGNHVIIQHRINGITYTTVYAHLLSISVSKGQMVDRNTVIGIMGGDPKITWWDGCSTGTHVHFQMATGLYGVDYTSWSTVVARSFNPRNIVNFPKGQGPGNSFEDRLTQY